MRARTSSNLLPARPPKASLQFTLGVLSTFTLLAAPATNAEAPASGSRIELGPYSAPLAAPVIKSEDSPVSIESTTINSCFSSGSGTLSMRVCVTTHGNISIESPIGNSLVADIRHEGYTVCDFDGLAGYDSKQSESGFGTTQIKQPNGPNTFPLTITRSTVNWKLTQTFARDAAERDFTITMALKNISGASRVGVSVWRYFDGDLDGTSSNVFDDTADSVYGRGDNTSVAHGFSLTPGSNTGHGTVISTYSGASTSFLAGSCGIGGGVAGPTPAGDFVGVAFYVWPSIAANVTKTVKFTYRVL